MRTLAAVSLLPVVFVLTSFSLQPKEKRYDAPINVAVPHISTDPAVKYDYDIVHVRAPRKGDKGRTIWTEIAHPALMDPGADLMLLHPDGKEEMLVEGGADGSITDPCVALDGASVYYVHLRGLKGTSQHGQPPFGGGDIYRPGSFQGSRSWG